MKMVPGISYTSYIEQIEQIEPIIINGTLHFHLSVADQLTSLRRQFSL